MEGTEKRVSGPQHSPIAQLFFHLTNSPTTVLLIYLQLTFVYIRVVHIFQSEKYWNVPYIQILAQWGCWSFGYVRCGPKDRSSNPANSISFSPDFLRKFAKPESNQLLNHKRLNINFFQPTSPWIPTIIIEISCISYGIFV